MSRAKRLGFASISLCLSSLLCAFALEAALRRYEKHLTDQRFQPRQRLQLLRPNPNGTGSYRLRPNLTLTTRVGSGDVLIRTNSHGMRWREVSVDNPTERRRVAVLGDSFTFGCWADRVEHSFVGVFETLISPRKWEVLNFGVGGFGVDDMELLLQEEVLRFWPRFVVIAFYNGNDFRDTFLGIHKHRIVDGAVELDSQTIQERVPDEWLSDDATTSQMAPHRSLVLDQLEGLAAFRLAAPVLGLQNLTVDFAVNRHFTSYSFWSQVPYPPIALEARDDTLATLVRIDEMLLERGIRLAVVAVPTYDQVYARRFAGPDYNVSYPQLHLQLFASGHGIPYLDLLPAFRDHVQRTNDALYVHGDTHFNNAGHALAGRLIARWFKVRVRGHSRGRHAGRSH